MYLSSNKLYSFRPTQRAADSEGGLTQQGVQMLYMIYLIKVP